MATSASVFPLLMAAAILMMASMIPVSVGIFRYEDCIRRNLRLEAPPPVLDSQLYSFQQAFCKDITRTVDFSFRIRHKLPGNYVRAVCNVFENDEQKVESFITKIFPGDYNQITGGISCANPQPPSPLKQ